MRHSRIVRAAAAALCGAGLCASPGVAHANSGIGLFTPASMLLVLGVIPVILVEAPVLRWRLKVMLRRALFLSLWANLASTLGGAVIGFALDIAVGMGTGMAGSAGLEGFLVALVLMFGVTVWIENWMIRTLQSEAARSDIFNAALLANALSYILLAAFSIAFIPRDSMPVRARMTEVTNVAGIAKTGAAEHYQAHGRFVAKVDEAPTKHVRRVVTGATGRITAEIAYPSVKELDGKTLVYEPVIRDRAIVEWRCYVPEAPLKYFPAACRYRTAGDR